MSRATGSLNARLGASVFEGAIRDYAHGTLGRLTGWHRVALALSLVVLAMPLLFVAGGLALMAAGFPNLLTLAVGALFVAMGWALRPRRWRPKDNGLTRAELPATFALLDRIAAAMGTEAPDEVALDERFNASIHTPLLTRRARTRITIGLPLWEALDEGERIALLAHELGHRVNGDIARRGPVAYALWVTDSWIDILSPSYVQAHGDVTVYETSGGIASDIVSGPLYAVAEGVLLLLEKLAYLDHNRAEYLADALASQVAGTDAVASLLRRSALGELVHKRMISLSGLSRGQGAAVFRDVAEPARDTGSDAARDQIARMEKELLTVDRSHPPTRFRIGFVEAIGPLPPTLAAEPGEMERIAAEFLPHAEKIAARVVDRVDRQ